MERCKRCGRLTKEIEFINTKTTFKPGYCFHCQGILFDWFMLKSLLVLFLIAIVGFIIFGYLTVDTKGNEEFMTKQELQDMLDQNQTSPSALIEFQNERGIVIKIGGNLSHLWRSGDVIVFWQNGEHTVLPNEFDLIRDNLYKDE